MTIIKTEVIMQDSKATPHRAHSLISLNLILEYSYMYILNITVITLSEAKVLLFYFLNRLQDTQQLTSSYV